MPSIWAIADLHLSFGVANKAMDRFGTQWIDHAKKIEHAWRSAIASTDLVLIPGDISWAMTPEEALKDLLWIDSLPGTKVLLKGNHDYWWSSLAKVNKILPPSLHLIQNNAFFWNDVAIGGSKLWDTPEYNFNAYYANYKEPLSATTDEEAEKVRMANEKIFLRELSRLETSLKAFSSAAHRHRIIMTHYPPIGGDLHDSRVSLLLEKYQIDFALFGHLHNIKRQLPLFGKKNGVTYLLTACDYLDFVPIKIF